MKIIVRIEDVEVVIDRPTFYEIESTSGYPMIIKDVVIPTIAEAAKQAKELYELKKTHII